MLQTERLLLRQWTEEDFLPFSHLCCDMARKIKSLINSHGWGFWAIEIPNLEKFIGFVGLHTPKDNMPFLPCVEVGWRLSKEHWGKGYATEAANESLKYAFNILNLNEVVRSPLYLIYAHTVS